MFNYTRTVQQVYFIELCVIFGETDITFYLQIFIGSLSAQSSCDPINGSCTYVSQGLTHYWLFPA